ncbi:hypothetical protein ACH4TP_07515 [Streptomyces sp. NPDC021012]|uniref:hypothetical protein n=1 Tax=Streptomyces sp. NPDC021012 TaxID=3365107 RepID=UPI0037B025EC
MLEREQPKGRTQAVLVLPVDGPDGPVGVVGDVHHRNPAAHPPAVSGVGSK